MLNQSSSFMADILRYLGYLCNNLLRFLLGYMPNMQRSLRSSSFHSLNNVLNKNTINSLFLIFRFCLNNYSVIFEMKHLPLFSHPSTWSFTLSLEWFAAQYSAIVCPAWQARHLAFKAQQQGPLSVQKIGESGPRIP